ARAVLRVAPARDPWRRAWALGGRQAARHQDLPRPYQLDDLELLHQGGESVQLIAGAIGADYQRLGSVVDHLSVVLLGDLQYLRASIQRAADLQQRDLGLDGGLTGMVNGVDDIDQLGGLTDDLLQRLGIAAAGDGDARESPVCDVRADDQALDVVAAARENQRHPHQNTGLVADQDRDRVHGRTHGQDGRVQVDC